MDGDYPRIERPTEPDRYYWWRRFGEQRWQIIKVFTVSGCLWTNWDFSLDEMPPGEWAGPIPPPSKKPEPPALTPLASRVPQRRRRAARLRQRTRPIVAEGLEP